LTSRAEGSRIFAALGSDRVAGGLGGVLAAGRGSPPEGAVGKLVDVPAGVLFEAMVVPALRTVLALPYSSLSWENSFRFRLSATAWKPTLYRLF